MTTTPMLGAVLLGSCRPDRLRRWYQAVLGLDEHDDLDDDDDAEGRGARLEVGGVELIISSHPGLGETNDEPRRMLLNFVIPDAAVIEARLVTLQAVWVREFEETPWGLIGTIVDPDGNYVQLIQPITELTE